MKIETKNAVDSIDLEFQIPEPGTYVWQIQEGVELFRNENSGKVSLRVPMEIDSMVEGDQESVGTGASHFIPIKTGYGEKQLSALLSITDLMGAAAEKFPTDVDPTDDRLLSLLKLKLPGKFIRATHTVGENNKGRKTINFTNFSRIVATQKGKGERAPSPPAENQPDQESAW